jgi:PAS domain S-box-containing protein
LTTKGKQLTQPVSRTTTSTLSPRSWLAYLVLSGGLLLSVAAGAWLDSILTRQEQEQLLATAQAARTRVIADVGRLARVTSEWRDPAVGDADLQELAERAQEQTGGQVLWAARYRAVPGAPGTAPEWVLAAAYPPDVTGSSAPGLRPAVAEVSPAGTLVARANPKGEIQTLVVAAPGAPPPPAAAPEFPAAAEPTLIAVAVEAAGIVRDAGEAGALLRLLDTPPGPRPRSPVTQGVALPELAAGWMLEVRRAPGLLPDLLAALPWAAGGVLALLSALLFTLLRNRGDDLEFALRFARSATEIAEFNQSRLLDFIELSSDWLWETDEQHRFTLVSNGIRSSAHLDPADFLGKRLWEIPQLTQDPALADDIRNRLQQCQPVRIELARKNDGGRTRHLEFAGNPLFEGERCHGYRGVGRDITDQLEARSALEEKEARFRRTFEHAPVGIANLSAEGTWLSVNDALCRILGRHRTELVGKHSTSFVHADDRATAERTLQRLAAGECAAQSAEQRYLTPAGDIVWVRNTVSALRGAEGGAARAISVVADITDRVRAVQALRASEERYRRLIELAPEGVMVQRDGTIRFANPACMRLFGARHVRDLEGRLVVELVDPAHREEEAARIARLSRADNGNHAIPRRRLRMFRLDGSLMEVETSGVAIELDGAPAALYIVRDITEQCQAEEALRDSQERYREVVDSVNEVIFRTNGAGQLTFLNNTWRSIAGYPIEQSLGRSLVDFLHPDDRRRTRMLIEDALAGRRSEFTAEMRLRTHDGEIRWIEAAARSMTDAEGHTAGISGSLDDITTRKIAELTLKNINQELEGRVRMRTAELENSNRELEAFSYSVSHDLRAPLRAIDGFAHVLEEDYNARLDEAGRNYLSRIRKASHRMATLIDDLIELARLTRQPLRREQVDLSEIAHHLADELRSEEPAREVTVRITPGLTANADRALVRVMLENLLRNAWKFTRSKEDTTIEVGAERVNDRLTYFVRDNGWGFDMRYSDKLFRPFHRLHTSDEFGGSGIGLATVQRIVQRHGGKIWAISEPGKGAQFYFTLG